jgi:glycerol uptake facilitator-like aquaporin
MNPLITIGTFFGQLATFPRTILYVLCQTTGATVAGFLVRAAIGRPGGRNGIIPGCWMDPSLVTAGEAVVLETVTCLSLIFLAFGIGLDPRQKVVYGPALGPLLIGLALGLCTFATGVVRPGYTGASMNPARCFGMMAAEGRWDMHWVHWVGAIVAGVLNGILYWAIPPSKPRKM